MNRIFTLLIFLFAILGVSLQPRAQVITFSETFVAATPPSAAICASWNTFRASLTQLPYTKMRFTGSLSSTVFECYDPVIIADIALKIRTMPGPSNANAFSWVDGPNTWKLGTDAGGRFGVNVTSLSACDNPGWLMKPCIPGNSNWGGFGTATCTSNPTQVMTLEFFYGTSPDNASASALTSPVSFCPGNHNVVLKVKNTGNNLINNVQIDWLLDGVPQPSQFYNLPIDTLGSATGNEALVTLGNVNFTGAPRTIKAWTSLPNFMADTTNYDDTLNVVMQASLQGSYTIGGVGADFNTFSAAATALNTIGVCGPVVFTANPGVYNEQLSLTAIAGASSTNTITFNGTGVTLQATPVSATRALIKLDGTDHVTIDGFTLTSLSATYGWGVHLTNGADSNTITNCNINMSATTSTTQSNSAGVVMSGSATSVVTAGNANYNKISNNVINGAYQGVIIYGGATSLNAKGNVITGNDIKDYYANGIALSNTDSTVLKSNLIHRPLRTTTIATSSGILMGAGVIRSVIDGNKIYDTHTATTTQTGTTYGIYGNSAEAPAGSENVMSNNIIYNFGSNTGTSYGIYNSASGGSKYYHNTLVLDRQTSTAGATAGIYQTGATINGIEVLNNIIYINRAGTGTKHNLYFNTATNNIISNANDLVMLSSGGTNFIGYHNATNYNTLGTWQTANFGLYDQQSVSIDPVFANVAGGDFTPTDNSLNNLGIPVGIVTDFTGQPRSAVSPDMGALEFLSFPLHGPQISFSISRVNEDVSVKWVMENEKDLFKYTVQRSQAGRVFEDMAEVAASGKSEYHEIDHDVTSKFQPGPLYYRIKMTKTGGTEIYSSVRTVDIIKHTNLVSVYPNPFTDKVTLHARLEEEGTAFISVYDVKGQLLLRQTNPMRVGANTVDISGTGSLTRGIYQLVFELNANKETIRLVK